MSSVTQELFQKTIIDVLNSSFLLNDEVLIAQKVSACAWSMKDNPDKLIDIILDELNLNIKFIENFFTSGENNLTFDILQNTNVSYEQHVRSKSEEFSTSVYKFEYYGMCLYVLISIEIGSYSDGDVLEIKVVNPVEKTVKVYE